MKTQFPEVIKNGDLELRHIKPTFELAKEVFEIVDRNRKYLDKWLPWVDRTKTVNDEYDGLMIVHNNEYSWHIFVDKKIVGNIAFHNFNEKRKKLEIGYWLDSKYSGRGIMTHAVHMIEKIAFETEIWNKIEICCDMENIPSQNVAKRAGYHLDGVLCQDFPYPNGHFGNTMLWSKLKSEIKN
ncbi:MAG: GNAT family N-acetyltransferase [Rickettsiales bacterium]|jgi:ribosomal-protein-serine acetyltransferase|nr:GNAT family N-acetyltransferase [Rickettsiales bacterium]